MLDIAGAGVRLRENFPAASIHSFRRPVPMSGDTPCLLCCEVPSAQNFGFLPSLQGFSAPAPLTSGGRRFLLGGLVLPPAGCLAAPPACTKQTPVEPPPPLAVTAKGALSRHCRVSPWGESPRMRLLRFTGLSLTAAVRCALSRDQEGRCSDS